MKTLTRRRLDLELVRRRLVRSRRAARDAVATGMVEVNGLPAHKPGTLVAESASVRLVGSPDRFVSRGGHKLEHALVEFAIDVSGSRCLDAGASTGGFTDCLLQHDADSVVAVDVGYGQLAWSLRIDPRVTVVERTNIRTTPDLGGPYDFVAADLSFISLVAVAPVLAAQGADDLVLLVKPQFEAGRERVGRGGVVRDPAVHRECVLAVAAAMGSAGAPAAGIVASPLQGPAGNREFLLWCRPGAPGIAATEVKAVTG